MNYKSTLAYAYDDLSYTKPSKCNVVAFARRKGHGIVEAINEDKTMISLEID